MAAAAPIALALSTTGKVLGGIEANNAGKAQAAVDEENARRTVLSGEQNVLQTRREERRSSGAMLAGMAGSGIQLGSGSAADVIAQNAYQRELEILNIRTRATGKANNFYQKASDDRAAGRSALTQSVFGAAAGALQGVSDIRARRTLAAQADKERANALGGGAQARPDIPPMRSGSGLGGI